MKVMHVVATLVFVAAPAVFAETAYVTDRVYVDIRADAAYESPVAHKVLAGAALEVLERSVDFTRVRDAQGREGWIENRELTLTPPPRIQQLELKRELADIRTELAKTQTQLRTAEEAMAQDTAEEGQLAKAHAKLKGQLASTTARLGRTRSELEKTQAVLEQAQTTLTEERAKTAKLAEQLAQKVAAENQVVEPVQQPEPLQSETPPLPSPYVRGSGDEPQLGVAAEASRMKQFLLVLQSLDFVWLGISFAMLVIGFLVGALWWREKNRRKLGGMYLR